MTDCYQDHERSSAPSPVQLSLQVDSEGSSIFPLPSKPQLSPQPLPQQSPLPLPQLEPLEEQPPAQSPSDGPLYLASLVPEPTADSVLQFPSNHQTESTFSYVHSLTAEDKKDEDLLGLPRAPLTPFEYTDIGALLGFPVVPVDAMTAAPYDASSQIEIVAAPLVIVNSPSSPKKSTAAAGKADCLLFQWGHQRLNTLNPHEAHDILRGWVNTNWTDQASTDMGSLRKIARVEKPVAGSVFVMVGGKKKKIKDGLAYKKKKDYSGKKEGMSLYFRTNKSETLQRRTYTMLLPNSDSSALHLAHYVVPKPPVANTNTAAAVVVVDASASSKKRKTPC